MKSKNFHYFKVNKSILARVALILALFLIIGGFIYLKGFFGQEILITPTGEGITPTVTPTERPRKRFTNTGVASYYCEGFEGNHTASGSIYHCDDLTFAHKTMKFGTKVKFLYDPDNDGQGHTVVATCTDRGPFVKDENRKFDLSKATFRRLAPTSRGVIQVRWEVTND